MYERIIRLDQFAIDKGHLLSYKKQNQLALIIKRMAIIKTIKQKENRK